jgi:hypothetical protein
LSDPPAPDPLKRAALAALGPRPSPAARRRLAARLRALADEQERIAAAQAEQQARPAGDRLTPRARRAGPGRTPATFVRVERAAEGRERRERLRLYIGRALWYAIGSPARIDVQRLGGEVRIGPGDEYAIVSGNGIPRCIADGSADLLRDLDDGRHPAEVRGRQLIVRIP